MPTNDRNTKQSQVKEFVDDLGELASEEKSCHLRPMVARAISSVVGSIVMNLTYRKYGEKEKFDRLIELMQEGFRLFSMAMPLDFIPIFRFLPGVSYAYKKLKKNRAETSAFFQGVADEHRRYLSETFNLGVSSSAGRSLHPRSSLVSVGAGHDLPTPAQAGKPASRQAEADLVQPDSAVCSLPGAVSQAAGKLAELAGSPEPKTGTDTNKYGDESSLRARMESEKSAEQQETVNRNNKQVELEDIVARDLVDAYIVEQKKHEKDGKDNYFSDQQLVQIMCDIFSAGLETVTSTIEWSILFLILNTECQQRIQAEIDNVIGRERMAQLDDLSQMPYTEATIYEVLRRSNIVTLGNAHATLNDATIGGYRIPKGTQVLPNLYRIHMNPDTWSEPDKFDPTRFIVNERAQKPDYFIPFSVGRRMCLGDMLAKMEVFLFLVGLLQKFDLAVAEEDRDAPPQVKGTIGASNAPASFKVSIRKRNTAGPSSC